MPRENEQIVRKYFNQTDSEHVWKCKCGKKLTQKKGTGWTNLMNHIKNQHPEYSTTQATGQPSSSSFLSPRSSLVSRSALNFYGWIEWVCVGLKPFSFTEDPLTHKYTNLGSITNVALKKYMEKLTQEVEKKISDELPSKFLLVIDGWTKGSTHFIGLFASYSCNYQNDYCTVLLAFSPMVSETSITASDYVEFIEYVLSVYNKNLENVVAITGDNTEVNKSIANLCRIPLIGCAFHKFNLAVSAYLDKQEVLLNKINTLMGKLKSLKLAGKLREKTPLQPIQRNKTRWTTTYDMIERYIQLKPFLDPFQDDPKLVDYLLTQLDHNDLQTLKDNLGKLRSVTIALQRTELDLGDARILFDEILALYPYEEFKEYLLPSAAIVHSPNFESGAVKILQHAEAELTADEVAALHQLKVVTDTSQQSDLPVEDDDFASICLKKQKKNKISPQQYLNCRFLLPTSNILERFFSSAGYAFNDFWQYLTPMNLEMQLFLKVNRAFWDEDLVSEICNRS
ncbi:uncharacterized protein LOC118767407 [Octopus sinensis]|uniref:Uncharacterized protein LOC118767407 n=1 Tax=Octopus sinensis TaxID=2607531 RepID=A0A7E6FJP4_9MOLL|nr:uncharacterized protein LOC118767407 [Octopus sinensis]